MNKFPWKYYCYAAWWRLYQRVWQRQWWRCQTPATTQVILVRSWTSRRPSLAATQHCWGTSRSMTWRHIITFLGCAPTTMTSCSIHHPQGYKLSKHHLVLRANWTFHVLLKHAIHTAETLSLFLSTRRTTCSRNTRHVTVSGDSVDHLEFRDSYSVTLDNMKSVHWPLMGGLWYSEEVTGRGRSPPRPACPDRCFYPTMWNIYNVSFCW